MPYFLVSLPKSTSPALRALSPKPCSHRGLFGFSLGGVVFSAPVGLRMGRLTVSLRSLRQPVFSSLKASTPHFLVSLVKVSSPALRTAISRPCSQVGSFGF